MAREAASVRHGLRGPLHLRSVQAAYFVASHVGTVFPPIQSQHATHLHFPVSAGRVGFPARALLLVVLWSAYIGHTGEESRNLQCQFTDILNTQRRKPNGQKDISVDGVLLGFLHFLLSI